MSRLRKDNYAKLTTPVGDLYGRVKSTSGRSVTIGIAGNDATVARDLLTKVPAAEYRDVSLVNAAPASGTKRGDKKAMATRVYQDLFGNSKPSRKRFLEEMEKYGLGPAGASNYFYRLKSGDWK